MQPAKMKTKHGILLVLTVFAWNHAPASEQPMSSNRFSVALPPVALANSLSPDSPFGINTAFHP
jgi:hypothetical protein